jgi:hypothetical protein
MGSTTNQASSTTEASHFQPQHLARGHRKLRVANKRMQSDHPTRYASCLAADARRYAQYKLETV